MPILEGGHPAVLGSDITQVEEIESYLAPWNEYQSCVLPQRGEKILQIGIHACVVLKQTALLNPIIISLFQ